MPLDILNLWSLRTANANEKVTGSNGNEPGATLTIHNQYYSQMFLGVGSSYVSVITLSKPVTESILFVTKLTAANRTGPHINGRS